MLIEFLGEANVHPCNRRTFFSPTSAPMLFLRGEEQSFSKEVALPLWIVSSGGKLHPVECSLTEGVVRRDATA